ncbi:MAG: DUF4259 domain-containing protein [Oscillibacter sp.]|jgi:hypothetical protein|nr:DUF4259 domain-containing protein [Oscillibacter sp.]
MGAWGIRALQSDEGLDVLDFLEKSCLPGHTALKLEELIAAMKDEGFFGETFEEIDFFYDHSALALAELYLEWPDTETFPDGELWSNIQKFTASGEALRFLLRYLRGIRDEVPDEDGEREIVELWKDSPSRDEWIAHLDTLIQKLEKQIEGGI